MHRLLPFLMMASMVLLLIPPSAPAISPALAEAGIYTAKFLGEYLVGKVVLDPLWNNAVGPDERVAELDRRLLAYETMLRQVDATQAAAIARLRRSIDTKTTPEDVRNIVNETLGKLRERVQEIESRLTDAEKRTFTLEKRVAAIEDLFGKITYFPPAPLVMRDGGDGAPAPHPRIKEWLTLLCKSEESRIRLIELHRDYEDSAVVVKKALAEDSKLVEASRKLHRQALEELSGGLIEVSAFKPGSVKRLPTDAKVAGLMWLVAVTKPVSAGEWKGRLGVPAALFGSQACEILEACELSGVDSEQVLGLYRRGLAAECAARPVYSGQVAPGVLSETLQAQADQWRELAPRLRKMLKKTREIDARHRATAKEYGPRHEKMIAVEKEKRAQVAEIKKMVPTLEKQLVASVRAYVKAAQEGERPTNARMTAFHKGVLSPLFAWRAALECADADWKEPALVGAAWERLCRIEASSDFLGELKGHSGRVICVAYSPDGKHIVSAGSDDKTIHVWNAHTGQEVLTLKGHTNDVRSVAYSPDGKSIVSGGEDKTLRVWDAYTGRQVLALKGHTDGVRSVAYSPDGKRIVSAGTFDMTLRVWDTRTGQEVLKVPTDESAICVAYSPDGKRIVSGINDSTIRVWNAQTGREILVIKSHTVGVYCVAYSPDGKRIVSGSLNPYVDRDGFQTIRVWDAQTGRELLALKGHTHGLWCAAYSPDGKRIVSAGSYEKTIRVSDAHTGREVLELKGHTDGVICVAFSPDGKRIVSGGHDKTLRVWDASTGATE